MNSRQSDYQKFNAEAARKNLHGAFLLVLSGLGFTVYLLLNKLISTDVHPLLLAFWRAFFGAILALPLVWRAGFGIMRTRRPGLVLLRSLFGTLGFTLAIVAVSDFYTLSLAQFNAISFTRPLFMTVLAALILREWVGVQRWAAVWVGFVGVLVMVFPDMLTFWRPGTFTGMDFDMGSVWAVLSALSLAAAIILVKFLSAELTAMALLLYANLLSSLILLPFAVLYWADFSIALWGLIILMSCVGFVSQYCYIAAMRVGEASFISPVDYLRLPMSAIADLLVFRLVPGLNVWFGALIIMLSTVYVGWRERVRSRRAKHAK